MTTDTPLDLDRLKGLVEIMAAERTKEVPHLFEDAVQEGMIAAWTASEKFPDRKPAYYHTAARNGVLSVLRGRPMTGEEGRRGWQDAHDHSGPLAVESADGVEYLVAEPVCPLAVRDFGTVEIAEEIRDAIFEVVEEPLDKAIVFGRFWEDLGFEEISKRVGRPAGTLSRRWTETVRPALRARLAEVVA